MRLFLSRFTLSSVAALALAGLIAGCSGGSSSLPGSTSATSGATNGSSTASMMLSKLQQQIATHNFTKAPASLVVHHMTQSEVTQKLAALGVVKGQTHVHQGSNAVDLPGGFGFVTTTSPPGPYSGIFAQLAAYRALTASPGIPVFTFGIQPGPPPVAASVSTDVMEALVAPGGGCYIPAVEFVTTEYYTAGPVFHQVSNNWFDALNLCAFTGNAFPLDQGFFGTNYINPSPGPGQPPTINVETFAPEGPMNSTDVWSFGVFNTNTKTFDDFTGYFGSGAGFQTNFSGGGFAGWVERAFAIGPCPPLPNATGGLGIQNIQLYNSTSASFTPLAPFMPGGTQTAFAPPNTNTQTCFKNDNTHTGQEYQINQSGGTPYYTGGGGQMLITSFPSP